MAPSQVRKVRTGEKCTDAGYVSYYITEDACAYHTTS